VYALATGGGTGAKTLLTAIVAHVCSPFDANSAVDGSLSTSGPCFMTTPTPLMSTHLAFDEKIMTSNSNFHREGAPFGVGKGRAGNASMHTPRSLWHTPECVLYDEILAKSVHRYLPTTPLTITYMRTRIWPSAVGTKLVVLKI
jgi:hypothetical protein